MQVDLSELTIQQIHDLMEQVAPGQWSRDDAGEVWRRSGGHPYLAKLLLRAWARHTSGGWTGAEEQLVEDRNYLLPTLAAAMRIPESREELRRCLAAPDGLRFTFLNPHAPRLFLYYAGLLRKNGRSVQLHCSAIRQLVEEALNQEW